MRRRQFTSDRQHLMLAHQQVQGIWFHDVVVLGPFARHMGSEQPRGLGVFDGSMFSVGIAFLRYLCYNVIT